MGSNEILVTVAVLFIGLMLFCGIFWLLICAIGGALQLFAFAAEQDFLGIIAYIAAWVFLFLVMLVLCAVIGIVRRLMNLDGLSDP